MRRIDKRDKWHHLWGLTVAIQFVEGNQTVHFLKRHGQSAGGAL